MGRGENVHGVIPCTLQRGRRGLAGVGVGVGRAVLKLPCTNSPTTYSKSQPRTGHTREPDTKRPNNGRRAQQPNRHVTRMLVHPAIGTLASGPDLAPKHTTHPFGCRLTRRSAGLRAPSGRRGEAPPPSTYSPRSQLWLPVSSSCQAGAG